MQPTEDHVDTTPDDTMPESSASQHTPEPSTLNTPAPTAVAAPDQPVQFNPQPPVAEHKVSPGIVVLQWLTYAFWGWTLVALSVLIFIVIFNLINHSNSGNTSLYTLAAIVVLLPISLVCDTIYQKHELKKKQGVSMAVMVIHAVIFALFAIGTLIGSLFAIVQLMINSGGAETTNSNVALFLSLLIISALYSVTFFRTLNPLKSDLKVARIFNIAMLVIIGTFTILAFVGPFAQTLQTKNDRLITENLTYVTNAISEYVNTNNKLPATLGDLSLQNDDAKQLLDKNLVTYKQNSPDTITSDYRYQLCVTFTQKDSGRTYGYNNRPDTYSSYAETAGHAAGEVCYKLKTENYKPLDGPAQLHGLVN